MVSITDPPFIVVQGVNNVRDIGGYPSAPGRPAVRSGFLYRSADPTFITAAGLQTLQTHRISTIYDLRSQPEIDKLKLRGPASINPAEHGIAVRHTPVFPSDDWSPEAQAQRHMAYAGADDASCAAGYAAAYAEIFDKGAAGAYRQLLLHIRDRPADALLFHCSAGKDRTGVAAAIILKLAGCDDDTIAREYALTQDGLATRLEFIVQHMLKLPEMQGDRAKAERAAGARADYMLAALRLMEATYGSVEKYVTGHVGLTEADVDTIKRNLV